MNWPIIEEIRNIENLQLELKFSDQNSGVIDFKPIAKTGVLLRLNDPKYFKSVKIVRNGRAIEWPGGIDFCADALYEKILELDTSSI